MKVYVLLGGYSYEGERLLGVYSSLEKIKEVFESMDKSFDFIECSVRELDGEFDVELLDESFYFEWE